MTPRALALALAAFGACAAPAPSHPALAQDDPMETRLYNVEFLTREVQDFPGQEIGLPRAVVAMTISPDESMLVSGLLSAEDLANLIKSNVAEDTWEHVAAAITYSNGVLTVTNKRSVQEKVAQYLNYWRGFVGKMITVDAAIVAIDPQLLARIRSAGNAERPAILAPDQARQVLEAAREGRLADLVRSMRVTAHPGQRVSLQEITKQHYLKDFDVQIATAALALDPILDVLATGASVDVRPFLEPFAGGVTMEVRADVADLEALEERKIKLSKELVPGAAAEGTQGGAPGAPRAPVSSTVEARLQLPRVSHDRIRTTLTVRSRETAIVGSVLRKGRVVLFLLTPTVVAADEKPAPEPAFEEQRLLRLYDISPLTRAIQDWPAQPPDVAGPSSAMGTPLTGATFTLMEPTALMESEDVAAMIKTRIAPETWGNKRNSINTAQRGTLVIRQKPEVLREIDRFLGTLLLARAQMITTEAVVIGFKKGARAEWEREIPALGPGGYFVEQEKFDRLLEEAYKGQKVRLAEIAEVTCFPQERVHAARSQEEAHVIDYEPQLASHASMFDPIVDSLPTGFVLDVRPHFIHGNEQIAVDFRGALTVGQLKEIEAPVTGAGGLQVGTARVLRWNSSVTCVKGKYSLVAIQSVGRGEETEDLAVFVRARQNVLK